MKNGSTNYKIVNKRTNEIISKTTKIANGFYSRCKGLMFSDSMENFDSLIIDPCKQVHTFFMKYPIDLLFLNKKNEVEKIYRNMPPWRISPMCWKGKLVVEFYGGKLPENINIGDEVEIICIN